MRSMARWILATALVVASGAFAQTVEESEPRPATAESGSDVSTLPSIGPFVAGMDPLWQPWIEAGRMSNDFFHTTVLRPAFQPDRDTYNTRMGAGGAVGITVLGKSTREILVQALGLKSAAYLVSDSEIDVDARWDVVFSRPSGSSYDEAWKIIRETLCEVAGISTEPVREEIDVLVANAEGTIILRHEEIDWVRDPAAASLRSIPSLLAAYERKCGRIVVPQPWQARLYLDTSGVELWRLSAEEFRGWLGERGVRFTTDRREVELTRVVARR